MATKTYNVVDRPIKRGDVIQATTVVHLNSKERLIDMRGVVETELRVIPAGDKDYLTTPEYYNSQLVYFDVSSTFIKEYRLLRSFES